MLKIAICDDNITDLSNMVSFVDDYNALQRDKHTIEYTAFQNAVDLIAAMESGHLYDLVLLDILMPFMTGMDAAKEIRQFNQAVKIIFLTSSPEYAVDSYAVDAYYYALKPIWKDKLFILLDKVLCDQNKQTGECLLIKSKTGLTRVYVNQLEFAEVIGRNIFYHLTDSSVVEATSTMSKLEKSLLEFSCFIKPHRSFIVNVEHIHTLNPREITMNSLKLVPLSKANSQAVKSAYIQCAFKAPKTNELL